MTGNINFTDLERFFARIQEMSINRDFNLSEYENAIKSAMQEFENYVVQSADNVKSQNELIKQSNDAAKKYLDGLLKAGDPDAVNKASKFQSDYFDKLEKENNKNIERLKKINSEYQKSINDIEKKKYNHAKSQSYSALSNGKSARVEYKGEKLNNLSDAFKTFGNKKGGVLGKGLSSIGGVLGKVGGLLTKFAGPIGVAIQAFQMVGQAAKFAAELEAKNAEIDNKKREYELKKFQKQYEILTEKFNTSVQTAHSGIQLKQTLTQNKQEYLSSILQAQGSFEQEKASTYSQMAVEGAKIGNDAYATAHEIAAAAPLDIKNTAYKAAEAAIGLGSQIQGYDIQRKYAEQNIGLAERGMIISTEKATSLKSVNDFAAKEIQRVEAETIAKNLGIDLDKLYQEQENINKKSKIDIAKSETERNMFVADKLTAGIGSDFSDAYKQHLNTQLSILESEITLAEGKKGTESEYQKNVNNSLAELEKTSYQYQQSQRVWAANQIAQAKQINLAIDKTRVETNKTIENSANEAAARIGKAWLKLSETINDNYLKHEDAAIKMGREMGLDGDKLQQYAKRMSELQYGVAKWGKDLEWMYKTQGTYQQSTGRNIEWSQGDFETSAAFGMVVGEDTIAQYTSGMEIFNSSVEDSNRQLYKMFNKVSQIGLNGKKYAKDIAQNLKLAEKYNFKDGVQGLMRMSKWAQNMRFNTASLDGMLEKVQEGGLEGVIKQAAELQVLGGNFAMGSDPLAMAYESFMDPEAYAKRMNSMIAGQGYIKKDGSVGFGIQSAMIMRQYAKSTGQDYKDVLNQARTQVKLGQIENKLNGNFNDDEKSLIANKSQFNQETQQWEVKVGNRKVAVDQLTQADVDALTPSEDIDQDMLTTLREIMSQQEHFNNAQVQNSARLEHDLWDNLKLTNKSILDTINDEFNKNYDTYLGNTKEGLLSIREASAKFLDLYAKGNGPVDAAVTAIQNNTTQLGAKLDAVNGLAAKFKSALEALGVKADIPEEENISEEINKVKEQIKANQEQLSDSKFKEWADKGDWKDDHFAKAAAIMAKTNPNSKAYQNAWDDIRGEGWFDLVEDGYEDWMTADDAIEAYKYLLSKGLINSEGEQTANDGVIQPSGTLTKINDGLVIQNGVPIRIDKNDQVLAAKNGGPIDKMLDIAQNSSNVTPRPMPYNSFVSSSVGGMSNGIGGNNSVNIPPIQININGSIQLNGSGGSVDITQQLTNDPNFIRSISQIISIEVEKKVNGGKTINTLNRNLNW